MLGKDIILPPNSNKTIKDAIVFNSRSVVNMTQSTLLVMNNLTGLQTVRLVGKGSSGVLDFTQVRKP